MDKFIFEIVRLYSYSATSDLAYLILRLFRSLAEPLQQVDFYKETGKVQYPH